MAEFNPEQLQQLDLASLVRHGQAAMRAQKFAEAAPLLREAARRAPFRQDLRALLAEAVEGMLLTGQSEPPARMMGPPAAPRPPVHDPRISHAPRHEPDPEPPIHEAMRRHEATHEPPGQRYYEDYEDEQQAGLTPEPPAGEPWAEDEDWEPEEQPPPPPRRTEPRRYDDMLEPPPPPLRRQGNFAQRQPRDEEVPPLPPAPPRMPAAGAPRRPPAPQSHEVQPPPPPQTPRVGSHARIQPAPHAPRAHEAEPVRESSYRQSGAGGGVRGLGQAPGRGARRLPKAPPPRGREFSRRHQRGPMSALVLGAIVGLLLIAAVAGGMVYYYGNPVTGGSGWASRSRFNSVKQNAQTHIARGEYSLAIEQLQGLPVTPERDQLLAEIFSQKGDDALGASPPAREAALENYRQALKFDPANTNYGLALGRIYYQLGREKQETPTAAQEYYQLARQTFEAVLERDAVNIEALQNLARVATQLRDEVLKARSYRRIIEIAPDSEAARDARNDLRSLGFKE